MLNGKKTYLTILASLVYAISAVVVGEMSLQEAVNFALPLLSLGFLRHGVANGGK